MPRQEGLSQGVVGLQGSLPCWEQPERLLAQGLVHRKRLRKRDRTGEEQTGLSSISKRRKRYREGFSLNLCLKVPLDPLCLQSVPFPASLQCRQNPSALAEN